jgi:hypothetical protein
LNVDRVVFWGGPGSNGGLTGNIFTVDTMSDVQTYVSVFSGTGNDSVQISSIGPRGGTIDGQNGTDSLRIGSNSHSGLGDILGNVYVSNGAGWTNLTLDDSADTNRSQRVRMYDNRVTGLGPGIVYYPSGGIYGGIKTLNILASTPSTELGNVITVENTPQNRNNNLVVNLSTGRSIDNVYVRSTKSRLNIQGQSGSDFVQIGNAGSVANIAGSINVANQNSRTNLVLNNSADTSGRSLVVADYAVMLSPAFVFFTENDLASLIVFCGQGVTTTKVVDTPQNAAGNLETSLSFGSAVDPVSIRAVTGVLKVDGGGGRDNVTVGYQGRLNAIQNTIKVRNRGGADGYTNLKIDGSNETDAKTVTIDDLGVRGLAPYDILFEQSTLNSLVVSASDTDSGFDNTFDIVNTPQNSINSLSLTVNSGNGVDTVNVRRIRSSTTINGQNGADTVNVGQDGSMQLITNDLLVSNLSSYSTINLNDWADEQGRAVTLDVGSFFGLMIGSVTGLSPSGQILFNQADLRALNIWSSSNIDFFLVKNTAKSNIPGGSPTTIHAGQGADTIRVTGTTGDLIVNPEGSNNLVNLGGDGAGSGSLTPLRGAVSVVGEGGDGNYLEIIDRASTGRYVYSMDGARVIRTPLSGTAPAVNLDISEYTIVGMNFVGANQGNRYDIVGTKNTNASYPGGGFQMYAGDLNDVVNVTGSGSGLWNINMGGGSNQSITFGDATHSLDNIFSQVNVTGSGFINATVSDAASSVPGFARFDRDFGGQVLDLYHLLGTAYTLINTFQFQFGGTGRLNFQAGQVTEFGQYNQIDVVGLAANTEIVANGGPNKELFTVMLGTNVGAQAGPVTFNGSLQGSDQVRYLEEFKGSSSQYSLRTNPLDDSGLVVRSVGSPTVVFNGMTQLVHNMPRSGDNITNIQSVPQNLFLVVVAGDGDAMTLGSAAPGQSRNMQNILGPIQVSGYTTDGEVTLTLDDSGNTTTARNASIVDYQGQYPWAVITGLTGNASMLVRDHANWNVNILGGTLDDSFVMSGTPLAANVSIRQRHPDRQRRESAGRRCRPGLAGGRQSGQHSRRRAGRRHSHRRNHQRLQPVQSQ